jgi:anthranilate phosphoribosyltransferase
VEITPESVGLNTAPIESVIAPDLATATAMIRGVLDGSVTGPPLDMALLNAGVALFASKNSTCIKDGVEQARDSIESGRAGAKLHALAQASSLGG